MTIEFNLNTVLIIVTLLIVLITMIRAFFFKSFDKDFIKESLREQLEFSRNISLEKMSGSTEEKFQKVIKELSGNNQESLKNLHEFRQQFSKKLSDDFGSLNELIEQRLERISVQVRENLDQGFKKTNQTFQDVMIRLTKIDEAQKNIEKLSTNVVSLQDVLTDKKSRGIFGEVQLSHILSTVFGEKNDKVYKLQHQLKGNKIVDAMIFFPESNGDIAVDSKFPLENYRRLVKAAPESPEFKEAKRSFKKDIKKHIDDIANKYIIPGVTADHAILFLPAEAIFAEINAYHQDIVDYSHSKKVALTSPTTFVSMLTTIQVILNNIERNKYTNVIHEELKKLGTEFSRYQNRWNKLKRHIENVGADVKEIHTSSEKISKRFTKISDVKLESLVDEPSNTDLLP